MNSSTFRYPMPAADPRTGRGEGRHQRRQTVGFAALPHDIAADPRLSPTDLRVLAALLYYARQDPSCYPSDASIAARVHRHSGTVRRCLKRLEDLGYIRREFRPGDPRQPHRTPDSSDLHRPRLVQTSIGMLHPGAASRYTRAPGHPPPTRPRTPTPWRRCTPTPARCTPKKTSS